MSNASPIESDSAVSQPHSGATSLRRLCLPVLQFVGFWMAVVLPFVLAGVLVGGLVSQYPRLVGGLLMLNFLGLVLGRNYNQ